MVKDLATMERVKRLGRKVVHTEECGNCTAYELEGHVYIAEVNVTKRGGK